MPGFAFQVEQRPIGVGEHSWVALEQGSNHEVAMPVGGQGSLVGQYPEIQEHLAQAHSINAVLVYIPQLDSLTIHPDRSTTWVFRRQAAEVTVHDIPRVVVRGAVDRS